MHSRFCAVVLSHYYHNATKYQFKKCLSLLWFNRKTLSNDLRCNNIELYSGKRNSSLFWHLSISEELTMIWSPMVWFVLLLQQSSSGAGHRTAAPAGPTSALLV